jgi:tagaturonate reductase
VLLFGTGMLLRSLVATVVDDANRRGAFHGAIVMVQSTHSGRAHELNRQHGLFTLVERGLASGIAVDRSRLIGSVSRALVADREWSMVREVASRPELQVIVSNVTEAGFRADDGTESRAGAAPASYPAKLIDILYARFQRHPDAPPVFVIPTELVPDNGPRLRDMVARVSNRLALGDTFRAWITANVRFCSSLVDRITTALPVSETPDALSSALGYTDNLITVTEPHVLWAVEGDPAALHTAFPVDDGDRVVFAPDITSFRERKLRLLNGAHTAFAPIAVLADVPTVRAATEDARVSGLFRHLLFDELVPGSGIQHFEAQAFARTVWERFRNPWIEHSWGVIATNQQEKMRIRVIPSVIGLSRDHGAVPQGLAFALAAHLRMVNAPREWLADDALWGAPLASVPGLVDATVRWLAVIDQNGVMRAVEAWWDYARQTGVAT